MNFNIFSFLTKHYYVLLFLLSVNFGMGQSSDFWSRVRFGGGVGAAFGNGYTDVTLSPGAIYQFNQYIAIGAGLQGTYVDQRNFYSAFMYGVSGIVLFNPLPEIQLSAEVEQLRVNLDVDADRFGDFQGYERNFWNTGLFLGAGYSMDNVTVGIRYNVLFDEDDFVYSDSWMPFVRVYF